jgi:hypothetical protein
MIDAVYIWGKAKIFKRVDPPRVSESPLPGSAALLNASAIPFSFPIAALESTDGKLPVKQEKRWEAGKALCCTAGPTSYPKLRKSKSSFAFLRGFFACLKSSTKLSTLTFPFGCHVPLTGSIDICLLNGKTLNQNISPASYIM